MAAAVLGIVACVPVKVRAGGGEVAGETAKLVGVLATMDGEKECDWSTEGSRETCSHEFLFFPAALSCSIASLLLVCVRGNLDKCKCLAGHVSLEHARS